MNKFDTDISGEFIRTALIIDDKADLSIPNDEDDIGDIIEPEEDEKTIEDEELTTIPVVTDIVKGVTDGRLDVKAIVNAFFKEGIMCGVFQPDEGISSDILVRETAKAVVNADVVILDWYLEPGNEELILDLFEAIFENDKKQNGRLRLILIYTDNPNLDKCSDDIKKKLNSFNLLDDKENKFALYNDSVRIKFLNKDGALGPMPTKEKDLAKKSIDEFSKLNAGIMPIFVLAAINSLRKNTHHLLSIFSKKLDPALVGHRLLLKDKDDAQSFGLEVLIQQIRSILTTNRVHHECLSEERFLEWFDDHFDHENEGAVASKAVPLKFVREAILTSCDAVVENRTKQLNGVGKGTFPRQAHIRLFNDDSEAQLLSTFSLGRLSKLNREFHGLHQLPKKWRPTLSLGSVLKRTIKGKTSYYFCSMPACDSVRIKGKRFFPLFMFEPDGKSKDKAVRISICDGVDNLKLELNSNPKDAIYEEFMANSTFQRVLGVLKKETSLYIFESSEGNEFQWLGDIDPLHAQALAAETYAKLARVGVDDFEWLRRGF